ncbi:MAG: PAS domain-containing protein [Synechococcaceae cyanobacterium SM2_3_2]|nr:PAS domain-containing protein [Synechococcaceae cyanobacterium SM2_3_2]
MGTQPAFFLTDQKGDWCHVDPGWQALTGTTADQALGIGWQSLIHPQEQQRVVAEWQAGIRAQTRFSLTYPLAHREGRYRTVHHIVSPSPSGYMGSLTQEAMELEGEEQGLSLLDLMFAHSLEGLS